MSRSGVNQDVEVSERVVLPRAVDVFDAAVRLACKRGDAEDMWVMILDLPTLLNTYGSPRTKCRI